MARAPGFILDGTPVTLKEVASEFSAYGRNSICDALKAGAVTRTALLHRLASRSPPSTKPVHVASRLYFARGTKGAPAK